MNYDLSQLQALVATLMWPLGRISGLLLVAPVLGAASIPVRVRIGLGLLLTLVLAPLAPAPGALEPVSLAGLGIMLQQIVLGAAIGFSLRLAFEAVSFGGQLVAAAMGLGFAQVINPQQNTSEPIIGQFYMMLVTLIFLTMNGHLQLIALLADGMRARAWTDSWPGPDGLWAVLNFASHLFTGALRVALPALVALLVVNIGFGAISRAAPSMNLFAVGFPISISLGLIVVWLGLRALPGAFDNLQQSAFELMRGLSGM